MTENYQPIVRGSSIIGRNKTVFNTLDKRVVIEAPHDLIQDIVGLCDGTKQYQEVVDQLSISWERGSLKLLLKGMVDQGVIVDAHLLGEEIWKAVENPMQFSIDVTKYKVDELVVQARNRHRVDESSCNHRSQESSFGRLLKGRRSIRKFSGETIDFQSLVNILWSAYGEFEFEGQGSSHRTTPSAGALYPLVIHVALFEKTGELCPGVYRVCYDHQERVGFKFLSSDVNRVTRSFLDPSVLNGVNGLILLSGSFALSGEKYGNRSMLYVPLEAGHVAQNIHLEAVDQNVSTLEIGGFVDQLLSESFLLQDGYHPLTTVAFGRESLTHEVNPVFQTSWAIPMAGQYRPSFIIASARISEKSGWSNGRDSSPKVALVKAHAEAKEWAACGSIPDLVTASYSELDSAIDPRSVIKFDPAQYRTKAFPFVPFNEKKQYAWTLGRDYMTNGQAYILADHVYFPFFPETPYYCFANSSGCAAHPDEQMAIQTATLELVERDSFMVAYLSKIAFPTVREETLPKTIQKRIADLRSIGFEVWVKDHSLDLAPTIMVFVQNKDWAYTKCASCSSFDIEHAVSHAMMEVEASVLSRLQNGQPATIKPHEVGNPLDHGRLYANKRYYQRANFLVHGGKNIMFQEIGVRVAHSWQALLDRLSGKGMHLLTISLNLSDELGGNGDLYIVRSIVPGLVPMTFGYRQEAAGMERIYSVSRKFGGKRLDYSELSKVPHPFE